MITDIFKKNYLLELNTDLQKYIKSFLSYDEIIFIFLHQYIPDIRKKNKRFFNNILKIKAGYPSSVSSEIIKYLINPHFTFENTLITNIQIIQYIEKCIIVRFVDTIIFYFPYKKILIPDLYNKVIEQLESINDYNLITTYRKKQFSKLIDIFNEDDPNIFI
jgi:hypothetical protein